MFVDTANHKVLSVVVGVNINSCTLQVWVNQYEKNYNWVLEIELELNLVSAIAIMSSLESKEYNTSFNRVRCFVKLLILQWKREIPLPCE